jgi:hypothetical protein
MPEVKGGNYMDCPSLSDEQVQYYVDIIQSNDDLVSGILSFISHETRNEPVSIVSLAKDLGKSRTIAARVFFFLAGMTLIDYSLAGMPRRYSAVLNENSRRVVMGLVKDENNPGGVFEITPKGVRKVEGTKRIACLSACKQ